MGYPSWSAQHNDFAPFRRWGETRCEGCTGDFHSFRPTCNSPGLQGLAASHFTRPDEAFDGLDGFCPSLSSDEVSQGGREDLICLMSEQDGYLRRLEKPGCID
jgi:hypothetical protein